jgi:hypothetical protein
VHISGDRGNAREPRIGLDRLPESVDACEGEWLFDAFFQAVADAVTWNVVTYDRQAITIDSWQRSTTDWRR